MEVAKSPVPAALLMTVAIAALAGCSSLKAVEAVGCAGARRPANPHGSVLATEAAAPAPAAAQGAGCGGRDR
jgi:hypothetical protein